MVVLSCHRWRNYGAAQGRCGLWDGLPIYTPGPAIEFLIGACHVCTLTTASQLSGPWSKHLWQFAVIQLNV